MQDVYKNIEECNPSRKCNVLIVFDGMIVMIINNKLSSVVTELFISGRKRNISPDSITQSHFQVPKYIRLNCTHFFIKKIPNKQELQQIAFNRLSDIGFEDFVNLYKKCTAKPYSFLVIDTTFKSDDPLRFRPNFSERI